MRELKGVKWLVVFAAAILQVGCLTPITARLDRANENTTAVNRRLDKVNAQLADVRKELAETNARVNRLERMIQRVPGLNAEKSANESDH